MYPAFHTNPGIWDTQGGGFSPLYIIISPLPFHMVHFAVRTVGFSAAVSIPLIAVAFNVSEVIIKPYERLKRKTFQPLSRGNDRPRLDTRQDMGNSISDPSVDRTWLSEFNRSTSTSRGDQISVEKQTPSLYRRLRGKEMDTDLHGVDCECGK